MIKLDISFKNIIGIYFIRNIINNKVYIGSSKNLYRRVYEHMRLLNNGEHHSIHLQRSFDKYGKDSFIVEVFSTYENIDYIKRIEPLLIKLFNSSNDKYGYNITADFRGSHGMEFTQERCQNISKSLMGKIPYNKCVKMSDEQKLLLIKVNEQKRGKSVDVFTVEGVFVETKPSVNSIVRDYEIDKKSLQRVLKGEYSKFKGFVYKFHN